MPDAFILSACRTPIGKFRGALSSVPVTDLGACAVKAACECANVNPGDVDEVILGNVLTTGVGQAPARQAALKADLLSTVAALTINKVCGSGLKAAMLGAQAVRCGDADIVVAGGMESMSQAPYFRSRNVTDTEERDLTDTMLHDGLTCALGGESMVELAEHVARQRGVSRSDQDAFALESHRRASHAISAGIFADEIVPLSIGPDTIDTDEGPRPDATLEKLGTLRTVLPDVGTVTAGNASMISDGAAAVVIGSKAAVERHGVSPLARIVSSVTVGGPPKDVFLAPVDAIRQVIAKAGRSFDDVDLFEINEAFASQMVACLRELKLPHDRVNIHGGAVALGHPIGASGARVLVTLLNALREQDKRTGVAALCLGGGNAVAMLVERV